MDMFSHLALGFGEALTAMNLLYCLVGILLGTLVGVLPGLGPVPTMAMLLPVTFGLPPTTGLIMLAGIFYGSQYGGSTSAILLKLPGEVSSIVTALDGYKMARSGRAGSALTVSALGSFFGGCVATFFLAALAVPLSSLALKFGPADYVSLMALGLIGAVALSSDSTLKAVGLVIIGMLIGLVGTDLTSGLVRYTFNIGFLSDGIDFVVIAMGLFGIASVISSLAEVAAAPTEVPKIGRLKMTREEVKASVPAVLRGTVIGSILGILPGGGVVLSSFMSYLVEKRLSSTPERFGEGAIEGVAGPESANNAASQTTFVPLLILGLPTNAVAALMGGAMMVHNIVPGPEVISSNPSLFWGLIASMWIGNAMLVFLNLPGAACFHALQVHLPGDHSVLLHRGICDELPAGQSCLVDAVWALRLCSVSLGLPAGTPADGNGARPPSGGTVQARHADVAGKSDDIPGKPDFSILSRHHRDRPACIRPAACNPLAKNTYRGMNIDGSRQCRNSPNVGRGAMRLPRS
mgnify:CR=1 FL=1